MLLINRGLAALLLLLPLLAASPSAAQLRPGDRTLDTQSDRDNFFDRYAVTVMAEHLEAHCDFLPASAKPEFYWLRAQLLAYVRRLGYGDFAGKVYRMTGEAARTRYADCAPRLSRRVTSAVDVARDLLRVSTGQTYDGARNR